MVLITMSGVTRKQIVPPDGGYGWVIVFACALKKAIIIPIAIQFGLVIQQGYDVTNITPTEGNRIIVWRNTLEMLFSPIGGPLLQRFGYRKVAVVTSSIVFVALVLTSTASSFWELLLYFTIMISMAEAASMSAFDLALNTFFKDKRTRAIGLVTFFAGFGPTLMPKFISYLLDSCGWRNTVLTLSALSLLCVLAACLLKPIKRYAKIQPIYEEMNILNIETTHDSGNTTVIQIDASEKRNVIKCSESELTLEKKNTSPLPHDATNLNMKMNSQELELKPLNTEIPEHKNSDVIEPHNNSSSKKNLHKIIEFFDLTLLEDPVFVNILCVLSLGSSVEVSFSIMLPFILGDMRQLNSGDTATLMTIISSTDLLFRLIGPYITQPWHKSPRAIYIVYLLVCIAIRTAMLYAESFTELIYVATVIGISKGINTAHVKVILPDYVPVDRLAYAYGLVRFFKGISILVIGEIITHQRFTTGSYKTPIIILNIFTSTAIVLWTAEFLYLRLKKTKDQKRNDG